jgi:hypothetical protein
MGYSQPPVATFNDFDIHVVAQKRNDSHITSTPTPGSSLNDRGHHEHAAVHPIIIALNVKINRVLLVTI